MAPGRSGHPLSPSNVLLWEAGRGGVRLRQRQPGLRCVDLLCGPRGPCPHSSGFSARGSLTLAPSPHPAGREVRLPGQGGCGRWGPRCTRHCPRTRPPSPPVGLAPPARGLLRSSLLPSSPTPACARKCRGFPSSDRQGSCPAWGGPRLLARPVQAALPETSSPFLPGVLPEAFLETGPTPPPSPGRQSFHGVNQPISPSIALVLLGEARN